MKFLGSALVILAGASLALAAKVSNTQVVDSGSFGVYLNGKRIATETFKVEQGAEGSTARSELKAEGAVLRSELQLTPRGEIVRYGWQQLQPSKAEASVVPKDEFLSEIINTGPNEKTFNVPFLMPHSTPIVDDNFFLHREILMWRYLASGCTSKPDGLSCDTAPQQFGVLIPAQHTSDTVTVSFKGKEKLSMKGKEVDCTAFRMRTEDAEWLVYLDGEQKLIRIVSAASGLEVTRD